MLTIVPTSFVEDLRRKGNIGDYLFKIEPDGVWFETQEVKTFQNAEYRRVNDLTQFVYWLTSQPIMMKRSGFCQKVTEIWRVKGHYKRLENRARDYEDEMILVWSEKLGWVRDVVYSDGIYKERQDG